MTIDELAAAAGTTSRNARALQTVGLLPKPQVVGRIGWYSGDHLERLRAILRLQREGFSLNGIGVLLRAWDQGQALEDVLGLSRRQRRRAVPDDDPFAWADGLPRRAHLVLVPGPLLDEVGQVAGEAATR
jgi:DNA-binding transcriptional MerR regulator